MKQAGIKSKRDKNYKYFTEVGYVGSENKVIPRWAVDQDKLKRVMQHQRQHLDPVKIFGKWGPKVVREYLKPSIIFKKGTNADSYLDEKNDMNRFRF